MDTWLLVDQGSQSSRAAIYDADGVCRVQASAPVRTLRRGSRVEQDPKALVAATRLCIERVLAEAPRPIAAGLICQRSSVLCWRRSNGAPLTPILSWQDTRGAVICRDLSAPAAEVYQHSGLPLSPHYGAAKMRWCLEHVPDVQTARDEGDLLMGPWAAYLVQNLTGGDAMVDATIAARTQLLDAGRGEWSARLLDLFGIPREVLPSVVDCRHDFGALAGIPLAVCAGDQSVVCYTHGAPDPRTVHLNMGTGAFLQQPSARSTPGLLSSVIWRESGRVDRALEGTVNGAAAAFAYAGIKPSELDGLSPVEPVPFLNAVNGLGSPWWDSGVEPRFLGRGGEGGRALGVAESIAFLVQTNLERMPAVERVVCSGGLAGSDRMVQLVADLSGRPVDRLVQREASLLGLFQRLSGRVARHELQRFTPQRNPALHMRYREALSRLPPIPR